MIYFAVVNHIVKILIVRFSSIGDIVLTTPVVRCLKNQLEGEVEIHYLTKKVYSDLLIHNPYITKIHSIEKSTNEIMGQLQLEQFDYVVDLHRNLRSSRVKKKLKALSFSFEKLNWQKWLLVNLKLNKMPKIHIVDRYLATVSALGVVNDNNGLDYFFDDQVEQSIVLPSFIQQDYVALVLGANHATKKLSIEKLKVLVHQLNRKLILIGGKEDQATGDQLQELYPDRIFNAAGKMNLNQSAALIKNASHVITPDTGMMHIAAAFQKKIISIWGNTVPDFGMYPYLKKGNESNSTILEVEGLNCRPCSKIGFNKCPKKHFNCIQQIDLSKIEKLVNN